MNLGYKLLLLSCTYAHPENTQNPETTQECIDSLDYIEKLEIHYGTKHPEESEEKKSH